MTIVFPRGRDKPNKNKMASEGTPGKDLTNYKWKTALLVGVGAVALAGGALLIYGLVRRRRRSPYVPSKVKEGEANVVAAKEVVTSEAPATTSQVYTDELCNVRR